MSSYTACTQLQEYLVGRLSKKSHNTKFKALLIIKTVCRTGRAEFKRDMARNTDAIKECLQFKGPPDPLRGDEFYRRVRDMAKETLDAIFDSQLPVTTSAVSSRITAFGGGGEGGGGLPRSQDYSSSMQSNWNPPPPSGFTNSISGASSAHSSGMQGFGNPNFIESKQEKSWLQSAAAMVGTVKSALSSSDSGRFDPGPEVGRMATQDGSYGFTTNRGNNAYGVDTMRYNPTDTPLQRGGMVPDLPSTSYGSAGEAQSDGSYERQLIEDLCEPGGMKAVPPEDKLHSLLPPLQHFKRRLLVQACSNY